MKEEEKENKREREGRRKEIERGEKKRRYNFSKGPSDTSYSTRGCSSHWQEICLCCVNKLLVLNIYIHLHCFIEQKKPNKVVYTYLCTPQKFTHKHSIYTIYNLVSVYTLYCILQKNTFSHKTG
jgi:hypothetical protein